jgi:hypothetical protein
MDEITLATESLQLVRKDLGLEDIISLEGTTDPFERLSEWLEKRIRYLLDHDFPTLLNALYRIDIPENYLNELLTHTPPEQLSAVLTTAILNREKQKVETRIRYRSGKVQ